jgi:CelD/BcsL family acetyltransferase involved in cellulose biosynthesis
MSEQLTTKVLRTVPEVEALRSVWEGWQCHPNSDLDFYLAVLRSVPGVLRPHIIMVFRDGHADAMLVGRREDTRLDFKIGYASFFKPRARALTFIYGGLLGNACPDSCRTLTHEVMKSLRGGEADVAFFNHLRVESPLYASLAGLTGFLTRDHFPTVQTHWSLNLPNSPEEFWAQLSTKTRNTQRRRAKRLLEDHSADVRTICFQDSSELDRMIRDVERVAQKTYQRGLGVGFSDSRDMRERLYLKLRKGWLRTYVLYVADKPRAFWSGTLYHGEFHGDVVGYDPEYSAYSPGMYLMIRAIEGFCNRNGDEKVSVVDFGLGDAQYKEELCNSRWQDATVYLFAPTLRGLALNAVRTPIILLDRIGRKVLERAKLLQRVKKMWRTRGVRQHEREARLEGEAPSTKREDTS